ncbi:MAG: sulfur carrier protein ThiS [Planctomycetes bacterium]|nr:sulfur carrier protein ThiS [Planctomycetota bacterium]
MNEQLLRIRINGEEKSVRSETTIAELLKNLNLQPKFLAVEINQNVVSRADHTSVVIQDGDNIEIVTLVGGG